MSSGAERAARAGNPAEAIRCVDDERNGNGVVGAAATRCPKCEGTMIHCVNCNRCTYWLVKGLCKHCVPSPFWAMTTSNIVKLAAGESLTMLIESASEVEGNYGKQVQFDGQDANNQNVTVYLSLDSVNRQLERIGLTVPQTVGEVLKIEKVQKNGKTYLNINRAAGAATNGRGKPTTPKVQMTGELGYGAGSIPERTTAMSDPASPLPWERERIANLTKHYEGCFNEALAIARKSGVEISLQGVSAMAATIFLATKGEVA